MATYDLAYPGAAIDAILNTAYFLQEAGYIFQGSASEYSGTPSKRVWLIAPAGFTGLGIPSAVPKGSIGICLYNGTAWVGKVINVLTLDSAPTRNSQNGVTSGGVAATLDEIAGGIMATFASLLFDDETAAADLRTKLSYAVKFSVSDVYQTVTHLNILAATTSKAGLMSAEDKAKVDSFLTNLRSLTFADTTASADQATQITETLKATIGGVQEVIDSITLLAATSSKAGLLSAADKAYIDALPATLTSLSNSISGALALMQSLVGYYVCDTAAGTAAKTVAATGYSLTNGGCIRIKMTNANTANNVTLNINSTGAKALYYDGAQASSTNTWEAGEVLEVYYDGTQYQCASGGSGKFATGQKVKDVGITNQIEDSNKLITSGAVYGLTEPSTIDLSQLTQQVCSLGGSKKWYRNGTSGPQRHIALPVVENQSFLISASLNTPQENYYAAYAWCTSSYSPPYSNNQTIPMVASESDRLTLLTGADPVLITAPAGAAYLIMTTVDGVPNTVNWTVKKPAMLKFETGEKVSEVGITDEIAPESDYLIKSGAVARKTSVYDNVLSNCINGGGGGTSVVNVNQSDLQNGTQQWATINTRIITKIGSLINVENMATLKLTVPYSSVSTDTHIDRVTLPMYDESKTYLLNHDLGWYYFNGNTVKITIDLTDASYSDVKYVGVYFGSNNVNISPSSINTSGLTFTLTARSSYYTKAVDEEMLEPITTAITEHNDILSRCYNKTQGDDTTYTIPSGSLENGTQDGGANQKRIRLKNANFIDVTGCYAVKLTVLQSYISDSNIDRITIPLYDKDKTYLSSLDFGWAYFNNGTAEMTVNIAGDGYENVAYAGIYFGSNNINISPSSIDVAGISVIVTQSAVEIKKAATVDMVAGGGNGAAGIFLSGELKVIAHLGGGSFNGNVAPMNSVWSALIAAKMGMRCCEFDIVFTSDDVPICCHDLTLDGENHEFKRKDGGSISNLAIGTLTYQTIKDTYEYRQGLDGFREVSTLYDLLEVYRDNNIIPCVEIKNPASAMNDTRYDIIINALDEYVGLGNAICAMFDVTNALRLRSKSEVLTIGISGQTFSSSMIDYAKQNRFICGLRLSSITDSIVDMFREAGVILYAWTVDYDMDAVLKMGLRAAICNYIIEPESNSGMLNTHLSNALDFSNITHDGTVTDGHLILASGQSAVLSSEITSWLIGISSHIYIKGTCTININGTNLSVNNADFADYFIGILQYNKTNVTMTINGACEIASLTFDVRSY